MNNLSEAGKQSLLTADDIEFLSLGHRNAHGGIYATSVHDFARAVEQLCIERIAIAQACRIPTDWYKVGRQVMREAIDTPSVRGGAGDMSAER